MSDQPSNRNQYYVTVPSETVTVFGRLVNNPQLGHTNTGQIPVCDLRVAFSRSWMDQNKQWQSKECFVTFTCWRALAERVVGMNLQAGDVVAVEYNMADIASDHYTDKEGKIVTKVVITPANVKAVARKANGAPANGNGHQQSAPAEGAFEITF